MSDNTSYGKTGVKRKLFQYSPHKVALALEAIKYGMKVSTASKNYNVPRTTLRHKISGNAPETSGRVGPQAVLGEKIENDLVFWIKECARAGFPINKEGLLDSVKKIVETGHLKTPFINNRPSRSWFEAFMARHPDLSQKHAEYINKARALITEEKIRNWYQEVSTLLGLENLKVLEDPSRVWNCDETSFFLAPKGGLVLAEKGQHVYDTSNNSDKDNITTLFTVNALGEYAPPLTVYKYKRMSSEIVQNAPKGWGLGKTDKGWMTGEAFYEYIGNVFIPYLKNKGTALPVILFLDGHKSHLTMHLSILCRENGIIVVALVPNTTHMLQPLDVAVFFPLKQNWRKLVKKWRIENDGQEITKFNLPTALHSLLVNNETFLNNVKAGFNTCGLYPFGPDFVNYKRIIKPTSDTKINYDAVPKSIITESSYLKYLESKIDSNLLKEFHSTFESGTDWEGKEEAKMLYDTWLDFKNDITITKTLSNHEAIFNDIADISFDNCSKNNTPNKTNTPNRENSTKELSTSFSVTTKDTEDHCQLVPSLNTFNNEPFAIAKDIETIIDASNLELDEENGTLRHIMVTPNKDNPTKESTMSPSILVTSNEDSAPPVNTPNASGIPKYTKQDQSNKESIADKVSNLVKECVLWPEKKIPKRTKKAKYIPSVLTSDLWVDIMQETERAKKNIIAMPKIVNKRARSLEKETRSESKAKKGKTVASRAKRKSVARSDSEESNEECDGFSVHDTDDSVGEDENSDCEVQETKSNYKIGDFVIFVYEEEYFVGKIESLNEEAVLIKSMQKTVKNWKWPERCDVNMYPYDDVKQKINTPIKVSKRDVYRVPEMEKYWDFCT